MSRILVIEDDESIRTNLLRLLKVEGFEAEGAPHGLAGLEMARASVPELILCDVMMPELDGHGVLSAVRADPGLAAVPFIFLTARADRNDFRQGMTLGADDYLTKPFSRQEVLDAVRSRLKHRQAVAESVSAQTRAGGMPPCAPDAGRLETALRGALASGELSLVYQPQVCLKHGTIIGAEALLRWKSAELGFVSPAEFIPVAERSSLILEIGAWVLRMACRQAAAWRAAGLAGLRVGVNVSTHQLHDPAFGPLVPRVLEETGLPGGLLDLEITESALASDVPAVAALLAGIKTLGASVSIDDFGTGYSGLSSLRQLPFDTLKIDRSFVSNLPASAESVAIVNALMQMAKGLRMTTIAEGVETPAELAYLRSIGCDQMQGYLFSRPVPPEELAAMAAAGKSLGFPAPEPEGAS